MTEQEWMSQRCPDHGITRCAACRMKIGAVTMAAVTPPTSTPRLVPPALVRDATPASVPAENIEDMLVGREPLLTATEIEAAQGVGSKSSLGGDPLSKAVAEASFHPDPSFTIGAASPELKVSNAARRLEVACAEYAEARRQVTILQQQLETARAKQDLTWRYWMDAQGEFNRQVKSFSSQIGMSSEDTPKS